MAPNELDMPIEMYEYVVDMTLCNTHTNIIEFWKFYTY